MHEIINVDSKNIAKNIRKKFLLIVKAPLNSEICLRYKNIDLVTPTEYEARINVRDFDSGFSGIVKKFNEKNECQIRAFNPFYKKGVIDSRIKKKSMD